MWLRLKLWRPKKDPLLISNGLLYFTTIRTKYSVNGHSLMGYYCPYNNIVKIRIIYILYIKHPKRRYISCNDWNETIFLHVSCISTQSIGPTSYMVSRWCPCNWDGVWKQSNIKCRVWIESRRLRYFFADKTYLTGKSCGSKRPKNSSGKSKKVVIQKYIYSHKKRTIKTTLCLVWWRSPRL